MRILLVSDVSIHHVIGGAERVLYEQATGLVKRGHEVHILTRRLPEHAANNEFIQGVHEWRYTVDQSSNLLFFLSTLGNGFKLFEQLQKLHPFDCINAHQPFSGWAVRRSPSCDGIPFIYTCHSLSFEEYVTRQKRPEGIGGRIFYDFNVFLRKWIERRVLAKSKYMIVLSEFTRDKLMTIYGIPVEKISIVPGGVDIDRFRPLADKREARRTLGLPADRMILFTVRNLVPRMGLENLIEAMKTILNTFPDVSLVIGGKGPLQVPLLQLTKDLGLEDHIQFAGFIPEGDLPTYFGSADAFVLPTIALEGFGLVTVEALACGTPALGTPIGGTLEILRNLGPDFLFRDTSPASIADLVINHLNKLKYNPEAYKALCLDCRMYAEANYSWQRNIESIETLFSK
ncbi:MAG: glycosyltransferase family 4 protein [Syntrophales bacterium]|nr:glycosyltransferase family 4 protein [Syntrophales bacterium]